MSSKAKDKQTIIDRHKYQQGAVRLWFSLVIGLFFFMMPIKINGTWTIIFDFMVSYVRGTYPDVVTLYCLVLILLAALCSMMAKLQRSGMFTMLPSFQYFDASPTFFFFRCLGALLAIFIYFQIGPAWLLASQTGGLMYHTLVSSVAVIVPIGAIFITLFVVFGGLDFIGALSRPVMRPLFKVPGRSALDAIASFVGSYSVGIYMTNKMYLQGRYSVREATIISTCFSTVSIGFFAVVANTLGLLSIFPLIFFSTLFVSIIVSMILVRIPPLSRLPDAYHGHPSPEPTRANRMPIWRFALHQGVMQAQQTKSICKTLVQGLIDGIKLSMVILPTILSVGVLAILIAQHTSLFVWLGKPMEPLLHLLRLPDVAIIAPATLIGITEMFLPALIIGEATIAAKFFIAVLSLTQILFFSAVIPLLLEIDIPIKLTHILVLFLLRTLLAIPLIAGITHLFF
ncbi:YjiH family protein [Caldalkalibacillus salinus]|uniref:YjiH family protein n=1 Tax=Caldalkalibacillus salinus TaxID=2803787 RepID=UPI001921667C|nr:YjiH family protein [Caldalkalibacillus salinus]